MEFRNYDTIVKQHYKDMRTNQTVNFVRRMWEKWHHFNHAYMIIFEAFDVP